MEITKIAQQVRNELVQHYGLPLTNLCIEASEIIKERLELQQIIVNDPQGWYIYELEDTKYGRKYAPHVWCEYSLGDQVIFIDVTLDQFQKFSKEKLSPVVIGPKPRNVVYDRPVHLNKYPISLSEMSVSTYFQ